MVVMRPALLNLADCCLKVWRGASVGLAEVGVGDLCERERDMVYCRRSAGV